MKKLFNKLNKIYKYLLDTIFPKHIKCIFCKDELNELAKFDTCVNCSKTLPKIDNPCPRCGQQLSNGNSGVCFRCKTTNYDFDYARSVFVYKGKVASTIHNFKYNGKTYLKEPFAQYLAELFSTLNWEIDYVTSVPLHKNKFKKRKYNQASLLAEEFSTITHIPFVEFLDKILDNVSQTSLNFKQRKDNVLDSFKVEQELKCKIKNKNILVIDDVITTGATTSEICKMLKLAGASHCYVLSVAHTDLEQIKN